MYDYLCCSRFQCRTNADSACLLMADERMVGRLVVPDSGSPGRATKQLPS